MLYSIYRCAVYPYEQLSWLANAISSLTYIA